MNIAIRQTDRAAWAVVHVGEIDSKNLGTYRTRQEACEAAFDFANFYHAAEHGSTVCWLPEQMAVPG
jgi:hypothetical protein